MAPTKLTLLIRFWAIVSCIVIWGVGVDLVYHSRNFGYALLFASAVMLITELYWLKEAFGEVLKEDEESMFEVNRSTTKRLIIFNSICSVIYISFGVMLFLNPNNLWVSFVASFLVTVLGVLKIINLHHEVLNSTNTNNFNYNALSTDCNNIDA